MARGAGSLHDVRDEVKESRLRELPRRGVSLAALALSFGCAASHGPVAAEPTVTTEQATVQPESPSASAAKEEVYAPAGFSVRQVKWPPGVVSEIAKEVPKEWRQEAVPAFVVEPPIAENGRLLVRGWLINDKDQAVVTYLLSAPHTLGPLLVHLGGPNVKLRPHAGPQMPEVYPAPEKLTLPPRTRIAYEREVVLSRYQYQPSANATLTAQFAFWQTPVIENFDVVLP